ncbi:MAG: hypothetical protein J2P24_11680 [Streptosporangiales bacterium]|nr:hypothetical protein [Streptosporangiales bacterium]MBO0890660.1 hypothetical protein [Acidothermales bacterium]
MNTEDDGARGSDAEQPQQPQRPQPNGADKDTGTDSSAGAATPPPVEPPVEPPPADQPSAEQLGAERLDAETAGPSEPETPGAGFAEEPAGQQSRAEEATEQPRETADDTDAGTGAGPGTDEYARQFLDSVDGLLGSVFRGASEFVDRASQRSTPRADRERAAPEDSANRVLDSVESWMSDFFRSASMARTAAGWGRAATGSAFRGARQRADDVWAQATSAHDADPGRECRYCPFCQTMAVVRNSQPELYEQIGDTAKTLVDLIRQAAEQSRRPRR